MKCAFFFSASENADKWKTHSRKKEKKTSLKATHWYWTQFILLTLFVIRLCVRARFLSVLIRPTQTPTTQQQQQPHQQRQKLKETSRRPENQAIYCCERQQDLFPWPAIVGIGVARLFSISLCISISTENDNQFTSSTALGHCFALAQQSAHGCTSIVQIYIQLKRSQHALRCIASQSQWQ